VFLLSEHAQCHQIGSKFREAAAEAAAIEAYEREVQAGLEDQERLDAAIVAAASAANGSRLGELFVKISLNFMTVFCMLLHVHSVFQIESFMF
jgi:hypothetical protein